MRNTYSNTTPERLAAALVESQIKSHSRQGKVGRQVGLLAHRDRELD